MKPERNHSLLDDLAQYGYPLLSPAAAPGPEEVLLRLAKQDDARLLEGFPVVLARGLAEKNPLDWENARWNPARDLSKKMRLRVSALLALSRLLFRLFGFDSVLTERASKLLSKLDPDKELLENVRKAFESSGDVPLDRLKLSPERFKNAFRQYVVERPREAASDNRKQELMLELQLSELFTSRQKTLLKKRLEGKAFTKTEREYYYRVLKKRLKALASDEVHLLARRILMA